MKGGYKVTKNFTKGGYKMDIRELQLASETQLSERKNKEVKVLINTSKPKANGEDDTRKKQVSISTKISIPSKWLEALGIYPGERVFTCLMQNQIVVCRSLTDISFDQKKADMLAWVAKVMKNREYFILHKRIKNTETLNDSYIELRALAETYFHFEKGLTPEENEEVSKLIKETVDELFKKYHCVKETQMKPEFEIQIFVEKGKYNSETYSDLQKEFAEKAKN